MSYCLGDVGDVRRVCAVSGTQALGLVAVSLCPTKAPNTSSCPFASGPVCRGAWVVGFGSPGSSVGALGGDGPRQWPPSEVKVLGGGDPRRCRPSAVAVFGGRGPSAVATLGGGGPRRCRWPSAVASLGGRGPRWWRPSTVESSSPS